MGSKHICVWYTGSLKLKLTFWVEIRNGGEISSRLSLISLSTFVMPCYTSQFLWRHGRVSDLGPGGPGLIPWEIGV